MTTLHCDHCGATFEQPPTAPRGNVLIGRCPRCYRPLADFEPRGPYAWCRVGVYAIERLRDEHARNQRVGF